MNQGKALYFSTQERPGPIVDHFRALGCTEDTIPAVIASERFDPREALARLAQTVASLPELKLVVLDMAVDILPLKDSNDYVEMARAFAPIPRLAVAHNLHICATHHAKKRQTENPVHSFMGSSAITASPDQLISLTTDSRKQRFIEITQRYGEGIPLSLLNWDPERRAMFLGQSTDEVKAEQRKATDDRIIKDMISYLIGNPGRTREEILDGVRGDVNIKRRMFNWLKDEEQIVRLGDGQKGNPYVYRLSDLSDETAAKAA